MKIIGLMPCRNEDWVLGLSVRAALMWVDELIILDHASVDHSRDIVEEIIRENPNRITDLDDDNPQWNEMAHRQRLLEMARDQGATHIAMIDADEILTGNLLQINLFGQGALGDRHCGVPDGRIMQIPWIQLTGHVNHYMVSGMWSEQDVSIAFRDDPAYHWQSAAGEEHFHHRHPKGRQLVPYRPLRKAAWDGGLMHLQFLSERRLRAKQALYQMTERIRWPERQPADYARTVRESMSARTADCPASWWAPYAHLMKYLAVNAEPWQQRECERLVAEHGRAKFAALDLFGVV